MRKCLVVPLLFISVILSAQSPKNLALLGTLQYPGQTLAGCWHYNSGGKEYALVGAAKGISIVDITVPASPIELFQLPGTQSLWHEVRVIGDYAYAVSEGFDTNGVNNGVQIIDLRFLPDSAPNFFYQGDGLINGQLNTAHTINADGNYIYINGHNITSLGRGVIILNVSNPVQPVYLGAITARYCHDSYVRGSTIYTSDILDGLFSVYDITDPASPILLATQITPGQFNHNAWLNDAGNVLFTTDERPSEPVGSYDISDLNNITLLDTFFNGNFPSGEVHNVRVLNDFLINPSYGSQLTIADASRPDNIIETASYITGTSLCWDADPYTASGNIIATEMNSGTFFVFAPTYVRACFLEGNVTDSITGLPIFNASVEILGFSIVKSTDFAGLYKTGIADAATYTLQYSAAGYDTKLLSIPLQNGVVTTMDVRLFQTGTGIEDMKDKGLTLYSNPLASSISIDAGTEAISEWRILNSLGKVVLEGGKNQPGKLTISTLSISPGIYSVEVLTKENRYAESFISY